MIGRVSLFLASRILCARTAQPSQNPDAPRILVVRRNRIGDMICTLPLLHALRDNFPKAFIAVACDPLAEPIARACAAVSETITLHSGGFQPLTLFRNARRLQGFDWVVAAKGGFDRRLAGLARLSNASTRIGFEERQERESAYYTNPVDLPPAGQEHQIETLLRLLAPLRITGPVSISLQIDLPASARSFATTQLSSPIFAASTGLALINISSTSQVRFREEDFLELATLARTSTAWVIGFVAAPADQAKARELAVRAGSDRVVAFATPGLLELGALLERATLLITPEGGAAHLAAAVGTPAVVLWSDGPFAKWHSRSENHVFVQAEPGEEILSTKKVWRAVESLEAVTGKRKASR